MSAAALLLLLVASHTAPTTLRPEDPSTAHLDKLIAQPGAPEVQVPALAAMLLDAELPAVREWLGALDTEWLAARSVPDRRTGLDDLRRRTRLVPEVIQALLVQPEIPEAARAHALSVGVEIVRAGRRPADFRQLTELLRTASVFAIQPSEAADKAMQRCLQEFTSLRLYSTSDLELLFRYAPASSRCALLDGVAGGDDPEFAARGLIRLLTVDPEHDPAVLNRLHLALQRHPQGAAPRIAQRVVPFLDDPRAFARHEAAACLGRIGERDQVRPLIDRLVDDEIAVRTAAHASLHQLTGMALPPHPERWLQWLERQLSWWVDRGEARVGDLSLASRPEQLAILREICNMRLYHEEIATRLGELLEDGDLETQCLALSALGTLRSPSALGLVRAFEAHRDPAVRKAAQAAVRSYQQAEACLRRRPERGSR